jgi:hypothetical protein
MNTTEAVRSARHAVGRAAGHKLSTFDRVLVRRVRDRRGGHNMRLSVVFVWWDPVVARPALDLLMRALDHTFAGDLTVDVVMNGSCDVPVFDDRRISVVHGDNSSGEFSGFQAGIDARRHSRPAPDVWLVCNDRYDAYDDGLHQLPLGPLVAVVAWSGGLWGHIDRFGSDARWGDRDLSWWVRSSFMLIDNDTLSRLDSLISVDSDGMATLLPETWTAQVDPFEQFDGFGPYLGDWLTDNDDTAIVDRWYGAAPLSATTWPVVRRKVQAILNEHLLSTRCVELGRPVASLRIAATLLAAGARPDEVVGRLSDHHWPGSRTENPLMRARLLVGALVGAGPRRRTATPSRSESPHGIV